MIKTHHITADQHSRDSFSMTVLEKIKADLNRALRDPLPDEIHIYVRGYYEPLPVIDVDEELNGAPSFNEIKKPEAKPARS